MIPARAVRVLLLIGLVLLPGPAYAIALEQADQPEPHRSSRGYTATSINASNDSVVVEQYGDEVTFLVEEKNDEHVASDLRAPNRTHEILRRAVGSGETTASQSAVIADIREIDRTYPFVTRGYHTYYELVLTETNGGLRVNATEATEAEVAAAVRERYVVHYDDLSAEKQRTFDKIRRATRSEDDYGYRPWSNESVVERPAIVEKNGSYYALRAPLHVDDFDLPDGLFLGLVGSAVGIGCLLVGAGILIAQRIRGGES